VAWACFSIKEQDAEGAFAAQNEGFIVKHQLPGHAVSDQSSRDVSGGRRKGIASSAADCACFGYFWKVKFELKPAIQT
jgi:hypothetical protein